jgi:hypothetical protein
MALGSKVVDFVRLDLLEDAYQVGGVCQIPVMEDKISVFHMGVLVEVVYPVCVKKGGSSLDTVDFISFSEQKFCKICPVLARNACYECFFCHATSCFGYGVKLSAVEMVLGNQFFRKLVWAVIVGAVADACLQSISFVVCPDQMV